MSKNKDKIRESYKTSKNIYDDILTQDKWWSKLYIKLFWSGVDDNKIAEEILKYIPNNFNGEILDVPVGTAVFTINKYQELKEAKIICLDYSEDMLSQAQKRIEETKLNNIDLIQGDVGNLPFKDNSFDIILSMNGFHAFPDKNNAFYEISRVLKKNGKFIACFYIKDEVKITDILVNTVLSKKGWFTPPFDTKNSIKNKLKEKYIIDTFEVKGAILYFSARKK
jgi:ubiquinone/menaquinone biosynthesis C-methylase UbiE